jgi:hypothetical protein
MRCATSIPNCKKIIAELSRKIAAGPASKPETDLEVQRPGKRRTSWLLQAPSRVRDV